MNDRHERGMKVYYSDMGCIVEDQLWTPEDLDGATTGGRFSSGALATTPQVSGQDEPPAALTASEGSLLAAGRLWLARDGVGVRQHGHLVAAELVVGLHVGLQGV